MGSFSSSWEDPEGYAPADQEARVPFAFESAWAILEQGERVFLGMVGKQPKFNCHMGPKPVVLKHN